MADGGITAVECSSVALHDESSSASAVPAIRCTSQCKIMATGFSSEGVLVIVFLLRSCKQ